MSEGRYDVAVVGAGPVGLAAGLALARAGLRTILLGPEPERRDGRTAALLPGSLDILESVGLWPALQARSGPLRTLRIVDDTDSLFSPPPATFRASEVGLDAFGWNVPNRVLAEALADAASGQERLEWRRLPVEGFVSGSGGVRLSLRDGSGLEASLAVAADGRNSRMRSQAGLTVRERRYPQSAFTVIFRHELDHQDASTEFHTRAGPCTLVPLSGRRSSLVWVTSPRHAVRLMGASDRDLARAIEIASKGILGATEPERPRGSVPLAWTSASAMVAPRLALAGEAAHVLPPIGAQGLNLGFADVAALTLLLGAAFKAGQDVGGNAVLARYTRMRLTDIRMRSAAIDLLNRSLLASVLPIDAMRSLALATLARIGPLRRLAMQAGLQSSASGAVLPGRGAGTRHRSGVEQP